MCETLESEGLGDRGTQSLIHWYRKD